MLAIRGSEAQVDPEVPSGEGRPADFGEVIGPCQLRFAGSASQECTIGGEAMIGRCAEVSEFGVDGAQPGVGELMLDVPFEATAQLGPEFLEGLLEAGDLGFGFADVVGEGVDLVDGGGLLVAAAAAELGEGTELLEALPGAVEPVVGPGELPPGVLQGQLSPAEGRVPIRRPMLEEGPELGALGSRRLGASWMAKPVFGLPTEGVEDSPLGAPLVRDDAPMVDLDQAGDVPGVGGMTGAALAGVAGKASESGGAEEVDLGPGAALDAVDGACPGVGAVGLPSARRPAMNS